MPERPSAASPVAELRPAAGGGASQRARIDASRYTDPAFASSERERVFSRAWLAAVPEWRIPHPGDFAVWEELGESVLVVRDEHGAVRAFHNSCRHRGSKLCASHGRSRGGELRCPYHGWSYGLDGGLREVPRREGFHAPSRARIGLLPVRHEMWMGFVWINFDSDAPPLRDSLAGLVSELAPYQLEGMVPIQATDIVVESNWKAMLENVMDFYHVPWVHGGTIHKHVDEEPDFAAFGDHSRQRLEIAAYRFRQALDRRCTRGGPYSAKQISALHKYLIFPNFLINVLPYHLTVMQVFPDLADPSRCRLRYSFSLRRGASGLERARAYATWLASRYILREDLVVLRLYQGGQRTGRLRQQNLHDAENASAWFHDVLDRWIAV
jgi:phenylpropionate dioxygenase-like ring-hydroxylating dioxygenase large terminal subunit